MWPQKKLRSIDLDQACPTFLVLRATFRRGNLLRATNVFTKLKYESSSSLRSSSKNLQIYILHKKQIYLHKINQVSNYWLMSHSTLFFSN